MPSQYHGRNEPDASAREAARGGRPAMKRRLRRSETGRPDRPRVGRLFQDAIFGKRSQCGADTARLHVPTRLVLGKFCEGCVRLAVPLAAAERGTHRAAQIDTRDPMTAKILRFAQLSPARQALVRICQTVNYGEIQGLVVRDGEPIFEPAPVVVIDAKPYRDDGRDQNSRWQISNSAMTCVG